MILEGIVTTVNPEGVLNVAPMGPSVGTDMRRFLLRPFRTSTTFRNLRASGEGVLHVTDDVLLIARTAIGAPVELATRPAERVRGAVLLDACRYYEFRVVSLDESADRVAVDVETVGEGRFRDLFGLNRAKHAVVEAAILATRTALLPRDEILAELGRLAPLVEKTGGEREREAFALLGNYVREAGRRQGLPEDRASP